MTDEKKRHDRRVIPRWEYGSAHHLDEAEMAERLDLGWEPFAITSDSGRLIVHFKRQVWN